MQKPLKSINLETIKLSAHGHTHKEIAAKHRVSTKAVSERVARIKTKLNCKTMIQVVYMLSKNGVI